MGKLSVVNNHERRTPAEFQELGHLLKAKGIIGKHRVPLWEIALGLVLYQLGLSFRKTAEVLGLLGKEVGHVAVWYWNKKVGEAEIKFHQGPLPPVETWVKVGERKLGSMWPWIPAP